MTIINYFCIEIDQPEYYQSSKKVCGGSKPGVEKMLEFGRELFLLSLQLRQDLGRNETNKKMLQVCILFKTNYNNIK